MKTLHKALVLPALILIIQSCSEPDKKARLDELRMDREKISAEISKLENEIAASGDSLNHKTKTIAVTEVKPTVFYHFTEILGKIDADQNVTISAEVPGKVEKVNVNAGDPVTKGQVLAELDHEVTNNAMEELQNQLAFATQVYEKQSDLWKQKIGTELQFLSAKNNKEALEKRMKTVQEQINMSMIKAPVSGIVDEVMLKPGQSTAPGMPAFRVVNLNNIDKAKAEVAEAYAGKIKQGNDVIIFLPDLNKEIKSRISFVGKTINPLNRTFTVEVDVPEGNTDLQPNMIAVIRIVDYKKDSAIVAPINVIQQSEDSSYVLVAVKEQGTFKVLRKNVRTGKTYKGIAEVITGLKPGEKLITTGYQDLNQGESVKF